MSDDNLISFSADDMKDQEAACASCERQCDLLEYPPNIIQSIDYTMVLHDSGKIARWQCLVTTGQSASKWPNDCFENDWFPTDVHKASKDAGKIKVSCITREPLSGCNANEAVDLYLFPEFIVYRDVERIHLQKLFDYHTKVIAPRHQEFIRYNADSDNITKPTFIAEHNSIPQDKQKIASGESISKYVCQSDFDTYQIGTLFPIPTDLQQSTFVTICGHTLRDKRCGVTAPILREQFNIVLDEKHPKEVDNVDIDLVSHVGGHKVAGNVIIYGRDFGTVFYGRVFPHHVENIVDLTIMKRQILKPITRAEHSELW